LPRQGYFFCLETKEAKIQVRPYASLPHRSYPANLLELGLETFYPVLRRSWPHASVKISYALQPHYPCIILTVFARSFGPDEKEVIVS
jgi:hypothetical protein